MLLLLLLLLVVAVFIIDNNFFFRDRPLFAKHYYDRANDRVIFHRVARLRKRHYRTTFLRRRIRVFLIWLKTRNEKKIAVCDTLNTLLLTSQPRSTADPPPIHGRTSRSLEYRSGEVFRCDGNTTSCYRRFTAAAAQNTTGAQALIIIVRRNEPTGFAGESGLCGPRPLARAAEKRKRNIKGKRRRHYHHRRVLEG